MSQSQRSQNDDSNDLAGSAGNPDYPNYDDHIGTFTSFLLEHTILQKSGPFNSNDSDDDDDTLLEPTAEGQDAVARVPCYPPVLQRIVDRDYYTEDAHTFVLEIPLHELVAWDSVRGADLAQHAGENTLRYLNLFSKAIDTALEGLQPSSSGNTNNNGSGRRNSTGTGTGRNTTNNGNQPPNRLRDTYDVLQEQRLAQQARRAQQLAQGGDGPLPADGGVLNDGANNTNGGNGGGPGTNGWGGATEDFPHELMRRYELRILPLGRRGTLAPFDRQHIPSRGGGGDKLSKQQDTAREGVSLRHVRSKSMGKLVTIRGMVVRASDVKPYCLVATYSCDACGCEVYQVLEQKREFMPVFMCPSKECSQRGNNKRVRETLRLQTRGSKFVKFQELKLQELPNQVPMGHIPRSMSVYCRGELTRMANPGDIATVDGIFLPQRVAESGFRAMKAGLMTTIFLEAQHLVVHKRSYDESLLDSLSEDESALLDAEIVQVATSEDPIGILSASIAPEIFGHEDIKRALLLQLVGGCTRKLPDGMRIRGDINICLMGDPGVAKSQLLKHVASIAPRGVYTTGKGSSGVGLTAAVTKDTATGEMSLEGGALVLADRGVCAIDEFDKMDEADRTAIHEVMEQQTVSIAKAGIVATLNARAAVLAAANPLYSRYNRHKSLSENINLPNSLLSRFDLMFLILDIADVDRDIALARHVTLVHKNEGLEGEADGDKDGGADGGNTQLTSDGVIKKVSPKLLREYISRARKHQPVVPPDVAPYIVEAYVSLRMEDRPGSSGNRNRDHSQNKAGDQTVMTARQLLSILRLSQALARLRFSDFVAREDVDEAIRLTHMSKASLLDEQHGSDGSKTTTLGARREDITSRVFGIIRDYATSSNSSSVDLKLCEAMALRKGFTVQQLQYTLEEYESLEIIQINHSRTKVHFVT